VEVAQQEAVVNLLRIHLRESYATGKPAPRQGNRSAARRAVNIYRCSPFPRRATGPTTYVPSSHARPCDMWEGAHPDRGRPAMGDDPRYHDRRDRVQIVDEVDAMIEAWTETRKQARGHGVMAGAWRYPCGAVLDSTDVLSDPHLRKRRFVTRPRAYPAQPATYPMPQPGAPLRLAHRGHALAAAR